jgi:hypothetical protein
MQQKSLYLFFLIAFFFHVTQLHSQGSRASAGTDHPVRIEIPVKSTDESYHILPVNEKDVLLYFKSVETVNDTMTKWYFSLYDNNLRVVWTKSISIKSGMEVRDFCFERDTLNLLLLNAEKSKVITGPEIIVRIDCQAGKFTANRQPLKGNLVPLKFMVYHDVAYFGYNLKSEAAHILTTDLKTGMSSDYPVTVTESTSSMTGLIIDSIDNCLYATVRLQVTRNQSKTELFKLNLSGTVISETEISTISPLWEIKNLQLVVTNPGEILVVATYSSSGRSGKNNLQPGSSGFFTCRVRNGVQTDIRFKNFLELNNFQNVMGEKDMVAIKKKATRKNRSMNDYSTEVNLLVHPLTVHNDQILFLAESYQPEYHPENITEFDFYGRPYINTYNVFDGYRFTSAILAGFDKSGNLKWDNSLEIRNLISPDLNPKVSLYITSSDTMVLCYSSEARIASKIIKEDAVVEKLDFSAMDLMYPEDKMISDTKNYMVKWYGQYFLCYGYQEIKNINASENKKRLVYYFTKIKFE